MADEQIIHVPVESEKDEALVGLVLMFALKAGGHLTIPINEVRAGLRANALSIFVGPDTYQVDVVGNPRTH